MTGRSSRMAVAAWSILTTITVTTGGSALATPPTSDAGHQLEDETGVLTITVPGDWTDVDTDPGYHDDGSPRLRIEAAPDIAAYRDTWTTPGVTYVASTALVDPATLLANQSFAGECTDGGTEPFANSQLSGLMQTWTNCAGTSSRLINVAARPADGSFTAFLQLVATEPDSAAVEMVVRSFGLVPGQVVPEPIAPEGDVVTAGPVPAEFLGGTPAPGAVTSQDATGQITVAVPSTWADTDATPGLNDDGSSRPFIGAATNLDEMYGSWEVPGVVFEAYPFTDEPFLIDNLGYPGDCTDGGLQTFDNGTYRGYATTWSECGGTDTRVVSLAVHPSSESHTLYIEIQVPDADLTGLQTVLSSFGLTGSAG